MKKTTATTQFTEAHLPITLNTYDPRLELDIKAQANRGEIGLKSVIETLTDHGVEPSERIIRSIAESGSLDILEVVAIEHAESELQADTSNLLRKAAQEVARTEARELILKMEQTNILRKAYDQVRPVLEYIHYDSFTLNPDEVIRAQAYLFSHSVTTVAGLELYNRHLAIVEQLNSFNEGLPSVAGIEYDHHDRKFVAKPINYDEAAGR